MNLNRKVLFGSSFTVASSYLYNNDKEKRYSYNEISKHNNKKDGIWVTYKDSVYDITNFINSHPGGKDKILLAAGKGVEPYGIFTNNTPIIKK